MASWINDNRAAILNKNRVEYKGLAGIRQKALLKKIMRDLQGTDGEPLPNKTQKAIKDYYREENDPPHYVAKWDLRRVVKYLKREEISGKILAPAGSKEYLRIYNSTVTQVVNGLTEQERGDYLALAGEWNKVDPPHEVQQMQARKRFIQATQKYMKEVEREMGVKVCVFAALLQNDTVKTLSMETDEEGGFENSNKHAHANAMEAFSTWAGEAFDDSKSDIKDDEDDEPAPTEKKRKGIKKDLWELKADMEGNPMLPALDVCPKREALKTLIRSMTTMAYRKSTGNPHSSVPWGLLQKNPVDWIEAEYWPRSITIQDPSHIKLRQAMELYNLWRERQDNNKVPIKFLTVTQGETVFFNNHKRKWDVESSSDQNQPSTSQSKLGHAGSNDIVKVEIDEMVILSDKTKTRKEKGKDKGKGREDEGSAMMGNGRQQEIAKLKEKGGKGNVSVVVPHTEQYKKYNM